LALFLEPRRCLGRPLPLADLTPTANERTAEAKIQVRKTAQVSVKGPGPRPLRSGARKFDTWPDTIILP
jgi:hypothetical protein